MPARSGVHVSLGNAHEHCAVVTHFVQTVITMSLHELGTGVSLASTEVVWKEG